MLVFVIYVNEIDNCLVHFAFLPGLLKASFEVGVTIVLSSILLLPSEL